jgi:hypothetical protein
MRPAPSTPTLRIFIIALYPFIVFPAAGLAGVIGIDAAELPKFDPRMEGGAGERRQRGVRRNDDPSARYPVEKSQAAEPSVVQRDEHGIQVRGSLRLELLQESVDRRRADRELENSL